MADVQHLTFRNGQFVETEPPSDGYMALPPEDVTREVAGLYGRTAAYMYIVLYSHAVTRAWKPFKFGYTLAATWGLGDYRVRMRALAQLAEAGLVTFKQQGHQAVVVQLLKRRV